MHGPLAKLALCCISDHPLTSLFYINPLPLNPYMHGASTEHALSCLLDQASTSRSLYINSLVLLYD